ncbi:hypothetical protein BGZ49_000666 [Haplosporangium sp. Z 27]|nr:hypothetical protein BGZ49_000666 [Haplosporangium sp. Z 27]
MNNTDDPNKLRRKSDQESWLPGLAYVGAATIGGAVLVNSSRSMPVKVMMPMAVAAATGAYFLPMHTEEIRRTLIPSSTPDKTDLPFYSPYSSKHSTTIQNLKQTAKDTTSDMGSKVKETMDNVPRMMSSGTDNNSIPVQNETTEEMTVFRGTLPENPSSSRWSWWKSSDTTTGVSNATMPKKMDMPKMQHENMTEALATPLATSALKNIKKSDTSTSAHNKPHKIVIDKTVSSAAIKGHDGVIKRAEPLGKDVEETALKVHENVIDAAKPEHRQSRHEKYPIEISRQASQSGLKDGKFVVRVTENSENPSVMPERVRRGSKSNLHHGLENFDKRSSMIYNGVEHLEHAINKRVQKALEEEAEFWHQQSLKEEAKSRGGERAM